MHGSYHSCRYDIRVHQALVVMDADLDSVVQVKVPKIYSATEEKWTAIVLRQPERPLGIADVTAANALSMASQIGRLARDHEWKCLNWALWLLLLKLSALVTLEHGNSTTFVS